LLLDDVTPANPDYIYILSARTNKNISRRLRNQQMLVTFEDFTKTFMTTDIFDASTSKLGTRFGSWLFLQQMRKSFALVVLE
jgi:hypothetical protein